MAVTRLRARTCLRAGLLFALTAWPAHADVLQGLLAGIGALAVGAGPTSPAACTAVVPGGVAGAATTVVVQARDASGIPRTVGGDRVSVRVTGANSATAAVTDNRDGSYTAVYTPKKSGSDSVAITVASVAIGGSPFASSVVPGPASAAKCTATVTASVAGSPTTLRIQAKDANSNLCTQGGETFVVTVSGANNVTASVSDAQNGTYLAAYTPLVAGTDKLAVTLGGSAIASSPFSSVVAPGAANAARCSVSVPNGTAGSQTKVSVSVRDAYGNPVTTGVTLAVSVSGANSANPSVSNGGGGSYSAVYTPTHTGTDSVNVTLAGAALPSAPFASVVAPGPTSASRCTATVPAGVAGRVTTVQIQAKDAYSNLRTVGGDAFVVSVSGANTATPSVTDRHDGSYIASYTPLVAGTDKLAITLGGASISGSAFTSVVSAGAADPTRCTAAVPNGTAGSSTRIVVTVRDAQGNPIATGAALAVSVTGANSAAPSVSSAGSGTYSATYTPTHSGADTVSVTLAGAPIAGSPFTSTVAPAATYAATSTATVPNGILGHVTSIAIQARDRYGNPRRVGGDSFTVVVTGANPATLTVSDRSDGTYAAGYTPAKTGTDTVAIKRSGSSIAGSPFKSVVTRDTTAPVLSLPSDITAEATGSAGAAVTFAVTASDAADGTVAVSCVPASGSTFLLGTTTVTATATDTAGNSVTGGFLVTVQDTTEPVLQLPANITVEAAGPAGTAVSYTVGATDLVTSAPVVSSTPASGSVFALGTTTVSVSATDTAGNTASDSFTVTVQDTSAPTLHVPSDITAEATSGAGATVSFDVSATDTVGGALPVVCVPESGSMFPLGTTTVMVSAQDAAGNLAATNFKVTVADTTAPVLTLPREVAAPATGPETVVTFEVSAIDAVDGTVEVICEPTSGSTFPLGVTKVAARASDSRGHMATGSFNVVVSDASGPQLTLPENMTVEATGPDGAVVSFVATATDVVDGDVPVVCTPASDTQFPLGVTTVTATATTHAGAVSTGTFTVTVVDRTPPSLTIPGDITVVTTDPTGAIVTFAASATDAVTAAPNVTCHPASGSRFAVGVTTVDVVATDEAGNVAANSFTVTVQGVTGLAFVQQPVSGQVHAPLAPVQVGLLDAAGIPIAASGLHITLALAAGPEGASLTGTLTATTVEGVATFADLQVDRVYAAYRLGASLEGHTTQSDAFAVSAGPTDTAHCTATVPDGVAGSPTVMSIVARDAWDNPRTTGGDAFAVSVSGSNTATANADDNNDGTYTAQYTPTKAGTDQVGIDRGGQPIHNSPFTSDVASGPTSAAKSTATVPGGIVGNPTLITIRAWDACGNPRTSGGDHFTVSVSGANTAAPVVTDNGNGTYVTQYTPAQEGTDSVAIALSGTPIAGSPYASVVLSAEQTITLVGFADAWPSQLPRYMDISDKAFSTSYKNSHDSSAGTIQLRYKRVPGQAYLVGAIKGSGLKPNFCYQMKMAGKPGTATGGLWPGGTADTTTNNAIIRGARWWGYQSETSTFSTNNADAVLASAEYAAGYVAGYVYFGYFLTDQNGNIRCTDLAPAGSDGWTPISANRCFHITGKGTQSIGKDTTPVSYTITRSGAAYGGYFGTASVPLWYEKEPDNSMSFSLPAGPHSVVLLITEESFHNNLGGGTSSTDGGFWKTVFASDWSTGNSPVSHAPWIAAHGGDIAFTTP